MHALVSPCFKRSSFTQNEKETNVFSGGILVNAVTQERQTESLFTFVY